MFSFHFLFCFVFIVFALDYSTSILILCVVRSHSLLIFSVIYQEVFLSYTTQFGRMNFISYNLFVHCSRLFLMLWHFFPRFLTLNLFCFCFWFSYLYIAQSVGVRVCEPRILSHQYFMISLLVHLVVSHQINALKETFWFHVFSFSASRLPTQYEIGPATILPHLWTTDPLMILSSCSAMNN